MVALNLTHKTLSKQGGQFRSSLHLKTYLKDDNSTNIHHNNQRFGRTKGRHRRQRPNIGMHPYQPNVRDKPRWRNRKHHAAQSASSAIRGANSRCPHINHRNALQLLRPTGGAKHRGRRHKSQPMERTHSHNRHLQGQTRTARVEFVVSAQKWNEAKFEANQKQFQSIIAQNKADKTRVGAENINHKANSRQHTARGTPTNLQRSKPTERSKSATTQPAKSATCAIRNHRKLSQRCPLR